MDFLEKTARKLKDRNTNGLAQAVFDEASQIFRIVCPYLNPLSSELIKLRKQVAKSADIYKELPEDINFTIYFTNNITFKIEKSDLKNLSVSERLIRNAQYSIIQQLDNYLSNLGYTRQDFFEILKLKKASNNTVEGIFRGANIYLNYSQGGGISGAGPSARGSYVVNKSVRQEFTGDQAYKLWGIIDQVRSLVHLIKSSLAIEKHILTTVEAELWRFHRQDLPPTVSELFNIK